MNAERQSLLDLIIFNAKRIEATEGKSTIDSEYIAICLLLGDLTTRERGKDGYLQVMDILTKEFEKHRSDVLLYLGVNYHGLKLTPEHEAKFKQRLA